MRGFGSFHVELCWAAEREFETLSTSSLNRPMWRHPALSNVGHQEANTIKHLSWSSSSSLGWKWSCCWAQAAQCTVWLPLGVSLPTVYPTIHHNSVTASPNRSVLQSVTFLVWVGRMLQDLLRTHAQPIVTIIAEIFIVQEPLLSPGLLGCLFKGLLQFLALLTSAHCSLLSQFLVFKLWNPISDYEWKCHKTAFSETVVYEKVQDMIDIRRYATYHVLPVLIHCDIYRIGMQLQIPSSTVFNYYVFKKLCKVL